MVKGYSIIRIICKPHHFTRRDKQASTGFHSIREGVHHLIPMIAKSYSLALPCASWGDTSMACLIYAVMVMNFPNLSRNIRHFVCVPLQPLTADKRTKTVSKSYSGQGQAATSPWLTPRHGAPERPSPTLVMSAPPAL